MTKPVKFSEYIILRETLDTTGEDQQAATKPPIQGVSTSVVLGKNNDFKPFVVADDSRNPDFPKNKNLAPIIRAFKDSKKVRVYDSISRSGEPKAHTLGAKALFMVGGAVRDHLKGKTPKDIDLATDATPDEIRMILADAGFTELKKGRSIHDLPPDVDRARFFYVKGQDNNGNDFVFGVKVNGQEFELATFRKDSHSSDGRRPNEMSFGSHYDDAARRDLTFNSMYIALTNDNGPNSKLTDFHGGIHDLQNGNVKFVGNPDDRLEEDLLRALRYARFAAKLGGGNIDPNIEKAIKKIAPRIAQVISPERIQEEFVKGLKDDDTDPVRLISIYKHLGLLDVVFPGMSITLDTPEDYPQDRDPAVVVASLLRGNHPNTIRQALVNGKWKGSDIRRVSFLHDILNMHPTLTPEDLERYINGFNQSGIMGKAIESWWSHNKKGNPEVMHAFLQLAKSPRVRTMVIDDETGENIIDPDFTPFFDEFSKKPIPGMGRDIGNLKRHKEHQRFLALLHQVPERAFEEL